MNAWNVLHVGTFVQGKLSISIGLKEKQVIKVIGVKIIMILTLPLIIMVGIMIFATLDTFCILMYVGLGVGFFGALLCALDWYL